MSVREIDKERGRKEMKERGWNKEGEEEEDRQEGAGRRAATAT